MGFGLPVALPGFIIYLEEDDNCVYPVLLLRHTTFVPYQLMPKVLFTLEQRIDRGDNIYLCSNICLLSVGA